ncbi:MAG TPA: class E sortase [Mycobacteriales bacterium]|nr:class E sortase [Mycobacteriales bacterium]
MTLATGPSAGQASSATLMPYREPAGQRRLRAALRGIGELFITCGLVVLLFVVYLLWWTDVQQRHVQKALTKQLEQEWADNEAPGIDVPAVPGDALGILFIPRLGSRCDASGCSKGYNQIVVEGGDVNTSAGAALEDEVLAKGPAHYPGTAPIGGVGNLAIAGHRVTHGHPFKQLMDLKPGDAIVFETKDYWYTYSAVSMQQVRPTFVDVALPVPPPAPAGEFDHKAWPAVAFHAGEHLLTFSTCTPEYTATYRLILHGTLSAKEPRTPGTVPLALQPGHGLAEDHDTYAPLT